MFLFEAKKLESGLVFAGEPAMLGGENGEILCRCPTM
jgi:hypothetical protein